MREGITSNQDLSQKCAENEMKFSGSAGRLSPVSSQRGDLVTRMRLLQTTQHRAGRRIVVLNCQFPLPACNASRRRQSGRDALGRARRGV
jgi:hypothetical protein